MSDSDRARTKSPKPAKSGKPARRDKPVKRAKPRRGAPLGSIPERVAALDPYLYAYIHSQSTPGDRRSLLALHSACAQAYDTFAYLEIGSHRGGSLQSLIVDDRCLQIVSIDLRPAATPDDRGKVIPYPGNSTQRMLEDLRAIPEANLDKLQTIDAATSQIDPATIGVVPALSFIDGEHTHAAALQDARFCRTVMGDVGCIVFHDIDIVARAASEFLDELRKDAIEPIAYPLPDQLLVVEIPPARLYPTPAIQELVSEEHETMSDVSTFLSRTANDAGEARARVLDEWLTLGIGRAVRSRAEKRASKLRLAGIRRAVKRANPAKGGR